VDIRKTQRTFRESPAAIPAALPKCQHLPLPSADAGSDVPCTFICVFFGLSACDQFGARIAIAAPRGIEHMLGLLMTFVMMVGLQEPANDSSRADALEQARREKAGHLQQPTSTFLDRVLIVGIYREQKKLVRL
jgi:hypothetical protein